MAPEDNREIRERAEQWQAETLKAQLEAMGERKERFETDSGIPVKTLYTPLDSAERDYLVSVQGIRAVGCASADHGARAQREIAASVPSSMASKNFRDPCTSPTSRTGMPRAVSSAASAVRGV